MLQTIPAMYAYHFTNNGGLMFFIIGVFWWQAVRPWKVFGLNIGPWFLGLFLSVLFFENWMDLEGRIVIYSWPLLTAVVAAIPKFFTSGEIMPTVPPPSIRQQLIILMFSHLLISCWFKFDFVIDTWIKQYPNLLADDFSRSGFVIPIGSQESEEVETRGEFMLNRMEAYLKSKIENEPWQNVENVMARLSQKQVSIDEKVKQRMIEIPENEVWSLEGSILYIQSGYLVDLFAIWKGPTAKEEGYYLQKSCRIYKKDPQSPAGNSQLPPSPLARGQMECKEASEPKLGEPNSLGKWFN